MIKLITFTNENNKLLEFNFNKCNIEYFTLRQWISVAATNQTLTIKGNSFIAYDEDIYRVNASSTFFNITKSVIQDCYKNHDKILIISTVSDEPLYVFTGQSIKMIKTEDTFAKFLIDDKELCINNLHWIVLTRNE